MGELEWMEGERWKIENLVVCAINGQKWLQPGPDHMIDLYNLEYSLILILQLTLKVKLINHRYLNEMVNDLFQFNNKVLI